MPAKSRLEQLRSLEVSMARLSPLYGCGLMLKNLPRVEFSDPLTSIMSNYAYTNLHGDKLGKKLVDNSGLLKSFYDNAFTHKTPLRQNFRTVYGHLEVLLAHDPNTKTAWFIGDAQNRVALANYFRDATSLGLKAHGVLLLGSTVRLTAVGWQNLFDVLSDEFLRAHTAVQRVEVMNVLSGARWRAPCLGLGVTLLNIRELSEVKDAVSSALENAGGEVEG